MSEKQIIALTKASQKKKREALEKTKKAIDDLVTKKQKITIRSVAKEAGVSVSYIYKYPELAYQIQTLREQQKYSLVESYPKTMHQRNRSLTNSDNRLKVLEQEKAELIKEIQQLRANITKVETGTNSPKAIQAENIRLQTENQQLKQELEYAKQNLKEARDFILSQGYSTQNEFKTEIKEKIIQQVASKKQ